MKETSSTAQTPLVGDPGPYSAEVLVRFAYCDPAGVVFYPRYLEIFNGLVEDWLRDSLGHSFQEIFARGWGLPTVHLNVDFVAPSSSGEMLSAVLSVKSVGTSSITLNIVLSGPEGNVRVRGEVVLVLTDARENRPCAIPDDLRKQIEPFCVIQ
jgi:4-hydroxybenzoyl-CoA thioesterase